MNRLSEEIYHEFMNGNFVVKESDQSFNQVDPDHSREWLKATGKKYGGIVGITKTASALSRWALSYNLRTQIAKKTKEMLMIDNENAITFTMSVAFQERKEMRQMKGG